MKRRDGSFPAVLALAACSLGLLAAGCGSDQPAAPTGGDESLLIPFPDTPDSLVALHALAWTAMDTTLFASLLGPGFVYHFSDQDVAAYALPVTTLDRAQTAEASWRMFSGDTSFVNAFGVTPRPVRRIRVYAFTRTGDWAGVGPEAPFPGTEACRHEFLAHLEFDFGLPTRVVIGELDVYAAPAQREGPDGVVRNGYLLAGIVDPGFAPGKDEGYTWGMALLTYLPDPGP